MDLLIRGGTVVTMDAGRTVRRGDVLVRDTRIERVGRVRPTRPCRVLDATGCAVLPGLVQAHVHLSQTVMRGMADDLPLLAWLRQRIWPLEAAHDEASLTASARLGLAEMLLAGTTTILDMGTVHHQDAIFTAMRDSGIRAFGGKAMMDMGEGVPRRLRESTRRSLTESERLISDWHGAGEGRIAYALAPRFVLSCSESLLRAVGALGRERGLLVHSHAAEHAEERLAVRRALGTTDVEALSSCGIHGPGTVLAHGVQLSSAEVRKVARQGTRFVHCPSANLKLASGIAPIVAMRRAGVVLGLGADGAPCNNRMDPWTEMREASLLAKAREGDATALGAMDALAMATVDGARVLGIADRTGSVEVGKQADLVVVSLAGAHVGPEGDVAGRLVYSASAADVRHVIVDGRVLVRGGELRTMDLERVCHDARRQARRLRQRAGV